MSNIEGAMLRRLIASLYLVAFLTSPYAAARTRQGQIAHLFALIDQADEMVVYSEGLKREFVIYRSTNRKDFEDLKKAVTLKSKGGPSLCLCGRARDRASKEKERDHDHVESRRHGDRQFRLEG